MRAVLRAQARRAFVGAAVGKGGGVEGINRRAVRCKEGDHGAVARSGGRAVEGLGHPQLRAGVIKAPGGGAIFWVVILDPGMAEGGKHGVTEGHRARKVAGTKRGVGEYGGGAFR